MSTPRQIAEAFSGHRFADAYDYLAEDVRWVLVGAGELVGRTAVRDACEQTLTELAGGSTELLRFLTVDGSSAAGDGADGDGADGDGAVAVDAVGRYTTPGDVVTVVSSCDLYEFAGGRVVTITSYTVELDQTGSSGEEPESPAG